MKTPGQIEGEIDSARSRLDKGLAELDRRRHELTDVKLQLSRHPEVLVIAGGVLLLAAAGVTVAVVRARRREQPAQKAKRLQIAFGRAVDHPEKVARGDAPAWEKILASVGTTIAVSLTKRLLDRAFSSPRPPDRLRRI
jgi:hypothetical protein